jgi:Flp pilus assembly protein TadG
MHAAYPPTRRPRPHSLLARLRGRLRTECGQTLVVSVFGMVAMLGSAGFAVDVGTWFHQQRAEQAAVDAAALAGAQALPDNPDQAVTLAIQYAHDNRLALSANDVTISSDRYPNDTISVHVTRPAQTYFTKVFGINSVNVHVSAAARSDGISSADFVAPVAVSNQQPMLQCHPSPCTDPTELDLIDLHQSGGGNAAGNFSLLDLRINGTGSVGQSTLADWLENGYDQSMPLGTYTGVTGTMFNAGAFTQALRDRIGTEVLFPVYKPPIIQGGTNAQFNIIGWVGFTITGSSGGGSNGKIFGSFTRFIAQGLQSTDPGSQADFGVRAIQLVQ